MEIRTIVQRHNRYYLISTLRSNEGEFPFETIIVLSDDQAVEPARPTYRCAYANWQFATKGHENLVKVWPGP